MADEELFDLIDDPERRADVPAEIVTEAFLERIEASQPVVNAFITVTADLAREQARRVDEARERGRPLPLDGLTVALKDNIDVDGVRTTVGSKFFEGNVAARDAEVTRRLREAGAVIVGKAALHEFVFGATTNNPHYGACRNPWDLTRIPGGSSGGSGAALGADLCMAALGSDTGGSVRIPAALNGVTGLRPTFGRVSNRGAFPISAQFDTVGPMARSVGDVARVYTVIAGYDPEDPWAIEHEPDDPLAELERAVHGLVIGLPTTYFFEDVDPEIESCVRAAADTFADLGAGVRELDVPDVARANNVCTTIIRAEARALHAERLATQPELFGEDIRRRLALADSISGADLAAGFQFMVEWRHRMQRVFEGVDLLLTPVSNAVAPKIDEAEMLSTTVQLTRFTYAWSLAHLPGISLPCGLSEFGLPIGVQLAAARWREALLLRAGAAYQDATDWHRRRPALVLAGA